MTNRHTWELGSSSSTGGEISCKVFECFAKNGIKKIEISHNLEYIREKFNYFDRHKDVLSWANDAGVSLHSFHIPFSESFTVSCRNKKSRAYTLDTCKKIIDCIADDGFKTVVIHPSSEPIEDENRAEELELSIDGLGQLAEYMKSTGIKLCVEDLPRSCLMNCSFEALTVLNSIPDISLCFDTNHLLMQTNGDFLDDLIDNGMKGRIAAVHISDYDFINERHKLPGAGINDWGMILSKLEELDYDGAFMYEVSGKYFEGLDSATKPVAVTEDGYLRTIGDIAENHRMLMGLK